MILMELRDTTERILAHQYIRDKEVPRKTNYQTMEKPGEVDIRIGNQNRNRNQDLILQVVSERIGRSLCHHFHYHCRTVAQAECKRMSTWLRYIDISQWKLRRRNRLDAVSVQSAQY